MRAALLLAALSLVACGRSSTEPAPGTVLLRTAHGTLTVATEGHAFDARAAAAAIDDGFAQASVIDPRAAHVSLNGMVIVVEPTDYAVGDVPANGAFYPPAGPFHIRQGVERVMSYEVLHPICHQLGMPPWCHDVKRQ